MSPRDFLHFSLASITRLVHYSKVLLTWLSCFLLVFVRQKNGAPIFPGESFFLPLVCTFLWELFWLATATRDTKSPTTTSTTHHYLTQHQQTALPIRPSSWRTQHQHNRLPPIIRMAAAAVVARRRKGNSIIAERRSQKWEIQITYHLLNFEIVENVVPRSSVHKRRSLLSRKKSNNRSHYRNIIGSTTAATVATAIMKHWKIHQWSTSTILPRHQSYGQQKSISNPY